jgi:hypothetical protein
MFLWAVYWRFAGSPMTEPPACHRRLNPTILCVGGTLPVT